MIVTLEFVKGKVRKPISDMRLRPGESLSIGRTNQCDFVLFEDNSVSSQHAMVEYKGTTITLVDMQSTNGTYVNGERIKHAELKHNDEIRIGSCLLRISFITPDDTVVSVNSKEFLIDQNSVFATSDDSSPFGIQIPDEINSSVAAKCDSSIVSDEAKKHSPIQNKIDANPIGVQPCRLISDFVLPEGGGGRIIIAEGQVVSVGRTFKSDFEIDDSDIQPLHFSIRLIDSEAILKNLSSVGRTYVNGVAVQTEKLHDGDSIVAGRTSFRIKISGTEFATAESEPPRETIEKNETGETSIDLGGRYQRQKLPNSIYYYSINLKDCYCKHLIDAFENDLEFLFVVDGKHLSTSYYATLPKSRPLFSDVPPELVIGAMPLIVAGSEIDALELRENSESLDCVVAAFMPSDTFEDSNAVEIIRQYGGFFVSTTSLRSQLIQMYAPQEQLPGFRFFLLWTESELIMFSLVEFDHELEKRGIKRA